MADPTLLQLPTLVLNEGAMGATCTMSTIPAGSNRQVYVITACYNGGGNSSTPTSVTCNGKTATFIAGDPSGTPQNRATLSVHQFAEADVSAISGQTLTTSGATGTQKSVLIAVGQDSAQTAPTNSVHQWISTGGITQSMTRVANSLTIALGFTAAGSTTLSFTNPAQNSFVALTSGRRITYGSAADTARTANFTSTAGGSTATTALAFNVEPFPSGSITDLNGGASVKAGSTATVTASGFSPTGGTGGGKALTGWTGSNPYTFTQPAYVDGGTYPEPDTTQTFVFTDGSQSPTINGTLASPNGMVSVVVASPVLDDAAYLPYWMASLGYTPVNGDRFVSTTADCTVYADGRVTAPTGVSTVIWLWQASGTFTRSFNVTVNESGAITSVTNGIPLSIGIGFGI